MNERYKVYTDYNTPKANIFNDKSIDQVCHLIARVVKLAVASDRAHTIDVQDKDDMCVVYVEA